MKSIVWFIVEGFSEALYTELVSRSTRNEPHNSSSTDKKLGIARPN